MVLSTRLRGRFVSGALALAIMAAGLPALALAQQATPLASPEATPAMQLPPTPAYAEVVATGLANPRGMEFGPDGALYISEAGVGGAGPCATGPEGDTQCYGASGGVTKVMDGAAERVVDDLASVAGEGGMQATGPHDVGFSGDNLYVLIGLGGDPATRVDVNAGSQQFGFLMAVDGKQVHPVADVAGYETKANPDGGPLDANPFGLLMHADGSAVISDAGMNALLALGSDGAISTLAVFPPENATAPDGSEIPSEAVPTGIAPAQDGSTLVGQLTGFPFPVGGARVFSVPAGGGEPGVAYDGFTNVIDVATTPDGSVYVLEFNKGGILSIDPANPASMEGQLTRIAADGTRTVVASDGLIAPTGLAVDARGVPYVAVYGVVGNMGQVWRITPPA